MLLMSGNHRMSKGEPDGTLWDFRWYDSLGAVETPRESGLSESLKARILALRSTLYEIAGIVDALPASEIKEAISRRISNELSTLEWDLIT